MNLGLPEYQKVTRKEIREYNVQRSCLYSFVMSPCGLTSMLLLLAIALSVIITFHDLKYEYWSKACILETLEYGDEGLDYRKI